MQGVYAWTFEVAYTGRKDFSIGLEMSDGRLKQKDLPDTFGAVAISGLPQVGVATLPFVRPVFDLATNPLSEWRLIFPLALAPVTIIEVQKLVRAALGGKQGLRSEAVPAA